MSCHQLAMGSPDALALQNSAGLLCDTPASLESWPKLRITAPGNIPTSQEVHSENGYLPFLPLSLLASSWQLSCPVKYTLTAFTHTHKIKRKLLLCGRNQIPSIYKQQPNRQALFCNLHFSASCTRIEMCSYFPVTQIATSKREW